MKPTFKHPDKFQVLSFREWIRENLPTGREGFVAEDLDLVIRVWGSKFGEDSHGRFMLLELKFHPTRIGYSQKLTFQLLDQLLRRADPKSVRYRGYWVVGYDNEDWDQSSFWLNSIPITHDEFWSFLMFMHEPTPPYDFA